MYVRIDYARESPAPSQQIKQAIFRATEGAGRWTKAGTAVPGESLWEFLHHRDDFLLGHSRLDPSPGLRRMPGLRSARRRCSRRRIRRSRPWPRHGSLRAAAARELGFEPLDATVLLVDLRAQLLDFRFQPADARGIVRNSGWRKRNCRQATGKDALR